MSIHELRQATLAARLAAEGIDLDAQIPLVTPVRWRSAEDIARRAIAAWLAIQVAADRHAGRYTPEVMQVCQQLIAHYGLSGHLTRQEAALLSQHGGAAEVRNMLWKREAYWALLWTLGRIPRLGKPDTLADHDLAMRFVAECPSFDAFMQAVRLRTQDELLEEAQLAQHYHHACVQARQRQRTAPAGLIDGVAQERHAAFAWLLDTQGRDDWDQPLMPF